MLYIVSGYDINDLFQEAQIRWLKPAEVFFILQNHEKYKLTQEPPKQPTSNNPYSFDLIQSFYWILYELIMLSIVLTGLFNRWIFVSV